MGVRHLVPAAADPARILADLPSQIDAVLMAHFLGMTGDQVSTLAEGFIGRGLPSYGLNAEQVEQGMLVSRRSTEDRRRLLRRIALNVQSLLLGEPAASLPVVLQRTDRMTLNDVTARRLQLSPSWSVMTEAVVVGQQEEEVE